jgi:hypothetical protein
MELILSDEQKKLVKRAALLAKSYKPKSPEINLSFSVEQGGELEPDWRGSGCNINTESGEKDIDYEQFYDLIFEFVEDNMDEFLVPFNDHGDDAWGAIWCLFNYETKILTFEHDVRYYESSFSVEEGKVKQELAQRLINVKNESEDLQGNVISMSFDGGGDSGSIENGENELGESIDIPASFEDFGYDILEKHFGGWEINEGSNGNILLNFTEPGEVSWAIEINLNGEEGFNDFYDFEVKLDY